MLGEVSGRRRGFGMVGAMGADDALRDEPERWRLENIILFEQQVEQSVKTAVFATAFRTSRLGSAQLETDSLEHSRSAGNLLGPSPP